MCTTIKKTKKIICAIAVTGILATGTTGMNREEKDQLKELINTDTQEASFYTPLTYQAYSEALDAAIAVSDDFFADSEEINQAYAALQCGIEQLQIAPDKHLLQELYNQALDIDLSQYIPKTSEALENEIAAALLILDDPNAISNEVEQSVALLEIALDGLVEKPDKTELIAALEDAKLIEASQFLPVSYQSVCESIEYASAIVADENAVEIDVTEAVSLINESIDSLLLKPDRTALEQLIVQTNSTIEETYTTISYTKLQNVLPSVKDIFDDENATQEDVSAAEAMITEALDGLVVSTHGIYRISMRFSRESNNHVGSDWYYTAFYNGERIDGDPITARHGSFITISCKIVEEDSIPDVGSGYLTLEMEDEAENIIYISVYEHRGRYSGNRALWKVTATVTLIERV